MNNEKKEERIPEMSQDSEGFMVINYSASYALSSIDESSVFLIN